MKIVVVAVGKLKERSVREIADDYANRIARYARYEEVELKDAEPDELVPRFTKAIPERATVVALEVYGANWSSEGLAKFVAKGENDGTQSLVFLIGGSYGLPREISQKAHVRMSLSAMTLPHRLARVVLLEQIYRAFTILRGEPYSH